MNAHVLTINGGSSSLKFAVFRSADERNASWTFSRIGNTDAQLRPVEASSGARQERKLSLPDHAACIPPLVDVITKSNAALAAIGHRVVHGGTRHREPELVTDALLADLHALCDFAPEHEPAE